ncbi:MAG: RepB family plasmid replication initiator protein, partial [Methyloprofundus sp.]|nr:RepB family plasmid replication initiator protein [Methyloprofundus sp.]
MKSNNLVVVKHNSVVEAGYQLSIYESRILLTCIAKINSMKPLTVEDRFELSVNDIADLVTLADKNIYQALKTAIDKLAERWVYIDTPTKKVKKLKTRWVSGIRYMNQEGVIQLTFAGDILPYLSQLSREFTQYRLENVLKFKSTYSIRIYELLCKWSGDEKTLTLEWLRDHFQLNDKYLN